MRKFVIFAAAIACIGRLCPAAPVCASGTLAGYLGLGSTGCRIGSNILFNFQVLSGTTGASEISTSSVRLSPLGGSANPGLTTTVNVTSSAGNVLESLFTYEISGRSYTASSLILSRATETGDGAVTGIENFCAGGIFGSDGVSGCTGMGGALVTLDGAQNQDSAMFSASNLLSVTNDLTIDGGSGGPARGGRLVDRFTAASTATPEPMSFLLTGIGLACAASRRFKFISAVFVRR